MFSAIKKRLHLDSSLVLVILARVWHAMSGPVTIALVIHAMTLDEQGIYYGLIGIVGIQAFFELGLLNVLVSQVGHEMAGIKGDAPASISDLALPRMNELVRASRRWFAGASVLFSVAAMALGCYTFWAEQATDWTLLLAALVLMSAISVWLSPSVAILEGAGYREDVYRFRLYQVICGSLVVWGGLAAGLGIWVLPLSTSVQAAWMTWLVGVRHRKFFAQFKPSGPRPQGFSWTQDVVPIQWRAAVISLVCHFATQLFAVIVIKFHSAAVAAPLGMTLSITGAIQMLALAWVQTKYPLVSTLHGGGHREQAGTLWRQVGLISTGLLVAGFGVLILLVSQLGLIEPWVDKPLVVRFLTPTQISILGIGCVGNHLISLQGAYVFAQRVRPLAGATVIGYGAIGIAVWVGGFLFASDGVIWGYTATLICIALPVHTAAYLRFRARARINH